MNIRVQFCFRMNSGPGGLVIRSEVLFGIGKALKAHGIEIPFPQRDLHIKSSPVAIKDLAPSPGEKETPDRQAPAKVG